MSGVWGWVQSVLATLPRSVVTEIMRLSDEAPLRLLFEVAIVLIVLFLLFRHPYNPRSARLSKKEENALIDEWTPEPLLDSSATRNAVRDEPAQIVESAADAVVRVGGEDVLNWAASNFLGFATAKELKADAAKAIVKYGVGSCGPRGFYGTLDIHLQLEEVMSKFFGVTQSILYSDGLACLASVIPAFAKRDDLVVCDEGVNYAIQQGVQLSRSNVLTFKHNDMADLRRVLDSVREKDLKSGNTKLYRRFIVVEGLYQYHGDIAPLRDLIALKNEYRYRLVLDDSLALGVLGATGKGTYEHFGVDVNEVDIMCGVFDHTMSSVGGWCIGREPSVVDHQRLAGAGYCFSASSPPYTSAAGIASFGLLSRGGAQLVAQLRERTARMHAALHAQLSDLGVITVNGVPAGRQTAAAAADVKDVKSSADAADAATAPALSPVIHLRLSRPLDTKPSRATDKRVVDSVVRHMRAAAIAVVAPKYSELKQPEPSVRVLVTVLHDNAQIDATAKALRAAFRNALSEVVAADEKEIARLEESAAEAAASASPRGGAAAAAGAGAGKKAGVAAAAAAAAASSTAAAEEWLSDAHTKATLELTARLALLKPVLDRVAEAQIAHAFGGAAAAAAGAGAGAGVGARTGSRAKRSKAAAAAAAAAEETDGKTAAADAEEAVASAPAKRSSSRVRAAAAEADGAGAGAAAAAVTPIRTRSASKGRAAAGAGSGKKKK